MQVFLGVFDGVLQCELESCRCEYVAKNGFLKGLPRAVGLSSHSRVQMGISYPVKHSYMLQLLLHVWCCF
jgi:hypothetical protein